MATLTTSWKTYASSSFSTGTATVTFYLEAKYSSQSIAGNTTSVQTRLRSALTSGYSITGAGYKFTCTYAPTVQGSSMWNFGNEVITSGSSTVTHNSNGTKSISLSASAYNKAWNFTRNMSATVSLPTIPRTATITSAPNFNDEENPTIKYSNPAGNSVSSLMACISLTGARDDIAYRNISKTGTSYTFNLTEEERNILRNACTTSNSRTVKFYVRTVIGGSTLLNNVTKTLSIINATTTALTGNNQKVVKGYSKVQAVISTLNKAVGQKGATITKYRLVIGDSSVDISYNDEANVSGTINNAQNGTINIYAIDSRSNSTLVTKLASEEINYEPVYVNINNSSFQRDDNRVGDNGVLTLNGTFWNSSFGTTTNSIAVSYRFKKSDSSTWINGTTTITPTATNNDFTFSGMLASDNVDTTWDLESSYDLEITVTDELSLSVTTYILASAVPTLSIDKEGVGIMCAYDTSIGGGLQVKGKTLESIDISLLWTNSNPTTEMSANTAINLSSSNYDMLIWIFDLNNQTSPHYYSSGICLKEQNIRLNTAAPDATNNTASRNLVYNTATKYTAEAGMLKATTQNRRCVPMYCYGLKL